MRKITVLFPLLFFVLLIPSAAYAKPSSEDIKEAKKEIKEERKEEREEIRNELRQEIRENVLTGTQPLTPTPKKVKLQERIKEKIWQEFPFLLPAGVNEAKIVSIGGSSFPTTITVVKESKNITLNITEKTNILRKYGGKSSLNELKVGDIVTARGKWQDSDSVVLNTLVLRDLSIEKRKATFWGIIKSLDLLNKTVIFQTNKRGELKVIVGSETAIVNRRHQAISFSDLMAGDRIRVSGIWAVILKQMEEVRLVKDWTAGPKPSVTVTPTLTPVPSPT